MTVFDALLILIAGLAIRALWIIVTNKLEDRLDKIVDRFEI